MRVITHPENGRTYAFGRNRPVAIGPHFKFRNYHLSVPTPNWVDYSGPSAAASLANVFGNDVAGDCTIACCAHIDGVWTAGANAPFIPTIDQVFSMYSACEGPPGYPASDNGCDEVTVLNYWMNKGLAGRKIAAWMTVDQNNMNDCRAALYLFENLIFCIGLPDAWVNPFPSGPGFTWDVAGTPVDSNGHCFMAYGYDFTRVGHKAFKIDSWGMEGRITVPATMAYCNPAAPSFGGLYCALSWDAINRAKQKAPNGMDWASLQKDFAAMS